MKKNITVNYEILGLSEIAGKFVPTAHGTFSDRGAAERHARENMKHTQYKVEPIVG